MANNTDAANSFRALADGFRSLPAEFGLREHTTSIVVKSWPTGTIGKGAAHVELHPILVNGENPKVAFPSQREIAMGLASLGQVTIGPFTPKFSDAGGVERDLTTLLFAGDSLQLRITGPQCPGGVDYVSKNVNLDRALRVTITALPSTQVG